MMRMRFCEASLAEASFFQMGELCDARLFENKARLCQKSNIYIYIT